MWKSNGKSIWFNNWEIGHWSYVLTQPTNWRDQEKKLPRIYWQYIYTYIYKSDWFSITTSTLFALQYISLFKFLIVCYGDHHLSAVVQDDWHFLLYYKEHYFLIVFQIPIVFSQVKRRNSEESSTQWTTGIAEVQLPVEYALYLVVEDGYIFTHCVRIYMCVYTLKKKSSQGWLTFCTAAMRTALSVWFH